jgi:hypothetical protein
LPDGPQSSDIELRRWNEIEASKSQMINKCLSIMPHHAQDKFQVNGATDLRISCCWYLRMLRAAAARAAEMVRTSKMWRWQCKLRHKVNLNQ